MGEDRLEEVQRPGQVELGRHQQDVPAVGARSPLEEPGGVEGVPDRGAGPHVKQRRRGRNPEPRKLHVEHRFHNFRLGDPRRCRIAAAEHHPSRRHLNDT